MNLISRDQIYIAWSCDLYDLIMWPTLYIAQSCAFNAWSCYIYMYFLILWPISPDLVAYIARSCDLYRPILWPFSSSFVPNIHRPNLWTLSLDHVTYTRNVVSYNTWSCDLYHRSLVTSIARFLTYIRYGSYTDRFCDIYRPILWPISPDLVTYNIAQISTCVLIDDVWSCYF